MKTIHIFSFLLPASMIFTMIGCANQQSDATNKMDTQLTTTEQIHADYDYAQYFDSYDAFLEAYTKDKSYTYVYPLPDVVNDWEISQIELDLTFYRIDYRDLEHNRNVMIEIDYTSQYESTNAFLEEMSDYYFYGESEVVEQYDRYFIEKYTEDGETSYALYGFTGEENIMYTLAVGDKNPDITEEEKIAQLKEYQDLLEFQKSE